jgi:hypothetical protein
VHPFAPATLPWKWGAICHASDSVENGANEAALWFKQEELVDWKREVDRWVFEK